MFRVRAAAVASLSAGALVLFAAPSASAYTLNPPLWWQDGAAHIRANGGSCERFERSDSPGELQQSESCRRTGPLRTDECNSAASGGGTLNAEYEIYRCKIFSRNARSDPEWLPVGWTCLQEFSRGAVDGDPFDRGHWRMRGRENASFAYGKLSECLAPKVFFGVGGGQRLSSASSKGIAIPLGCSARCEISAKATSTGSRASLGTGKTTLIAGRRGTLRLRLNDLGRQRLRSGRKIKITVSSRSAGARDRLVFAAAYRRGRVSVTIADRGTCVSPLGDVQGGLYVLAC